MTVLRVNNKDTETMSNYIYIYITLSKFSNLIKVWKMNRFEKWLQDWLWKLILRAGTMIQHIKYCQQKLFVIETFQLRKIVYFCKCFFKILFFPLILTTYISCFEISEAPKAFKLHESHGHQLQKIW